MQETNAYRKCIRQMQEAAARESISQWPPCFPANRTPPSGDRCSPLAGHLVVTRPPGAAAPPRPYRRG
jgi:hypothetical protein